MWSDKLKEEFKRGNTKERKQLLQDQLDFNIKILKSSPDQNVLQKAQGRVEVLEDILSTFKD